MHDTQPRITTWSTVATAFFFVVAWLWTFNAAYVNGDDVLPLAKLELRNAFVPNFKAGWTPNRMLDAYGRDLLAAGFDLVYFSLRAVVQVDFFVLFKAYVATVYATFLTVVLRYLAGSIAGADGDARAWDRRVVGVFLAVVVLGLFPWRNQTHFVAYQLAAFLCFVLLNEIARLVVVAINAERGDATKATPANGHPALMLLAFICAFSLEAYAAMVLLCLLPPTWWAVRALVRARQRPGGDDDTQSRLLPLAVVMLVAITFCAMAIVVTLTSSQRADVTLTNEGLDLRGLQESGVAWLTSRRGVIALLLCAVPLAIAGFLRWRARSSHARAAGVVAASESPESGRELETRFDLTALGLVVLSSVVVTIVVSVKAHDNYFSHALYPWGALLLVAKLFATYTAARIALRIPMRRSALRGAIMLLAFMAASRGALDVLASTYANQRTSQQLHQVYRSLAAGGAADIDSGLDLASLPMQVRPLPTADSPSWFVAAFERFLRKYYGVANAVTFR